VSNQRTAFKKGTLPKDKDKEKLLTALNFSWAPKNDAWELKFHALCDFQKKHGHCNAPQRNPELGGWVNEQRQNFKNDQLAPDRVARLNDIGFSWKASKGPAPKNEAN
jgi:Helicase associated domain